MARFTLRWDGGRVHSLDHRDRLVEGLLGHFNETDADVRTVSSQNDSQ